jgi:outer membrane protein insertion porin family/translocation and assembly module TamA
MKLSPSCTIPIAGLSLWEFSNELRIPIAGPFATAVFCDMGDASPNPHDLRFNRPHLSCGAGASYDTPVGPIRLDVGYRIEPAQVIGFASDVAAHAKDPTEGIQPRIAGAPIAIAIGIGEAF